MKRLRRRRSGVRSSVDVRINTVPVALKATSLAVPVYLNGELKEMQAERRQRMAQSAN